MQHENTAVHLPTEPSLEERRARALAEIERLYDRAPLKLAELLGPDAESEAEMESLEAKTSVTEVRYPVLVAD